MQEVARAYSLAGNGAKVEQYFLRCAALNPRRTALYHAQIGWYFQRKKRWARAILWYDRALLTFPDYHLCLFRKGYCLERLHRPRAAAAAFRAAVEAYETTSPEQRERSRGIQAQVLFHLARSLREIRDTAGTREALDRCAELDTRPEVVIKPEHRLASYAATHLHDGDAAAAIRCLEEARERDARSAVIWERLGIAYAKAGRQADAEQALLRATTLPKGAVALISLGRFYIAQGRLAEAARVLSSALERHPQGEVQVRIEIADLHRRLDRPAAALEILERLAAGRVPPQSTLAVTVERRIADLLLAHGRRDQAVAHFRAALEHDPEDAEVRTELEAAECAPAGEASASPLLDRPLSPELAAALVEPHGHETGVVTSYFPGRGFGFISFSGKKQTVFFHVSHVNPADVTEIGVGAAVRFVVTTNPRSGRPQAERVALRPTQDAGGGDSDDAEDSGGPTPSE